MIGEILYSPDGVGGGGTVPDAGGEQPKAAEIPTYPQPADTHRIDLGLHHGPNMGMSPGVTLDPGLPPSMDSPYGLSLHAIRMARDGRARP
jgi:hypothetical protein